MRKITLFLAFAILLLSATTAFTPDPTCQNADLIFNIPTNALKVAGQGCSSTIPFEKNYTFSIPVNKTYSVQMTSQRGNPQECSLNEVFQINFNNQNFFTSQDDDIACAVSTRIEYVGDYNFLAGENLVSISSTAQCPPENTSNEIEVIKICLYKILPPHTCENITPVCGNGVLECFEQCDDGNNIDGDGCSATCTIETATPVCGNSVLEENEQCDVGNENGKICIPGYNKTCEYCTSTCSKEEIIGPYCGDGICSLIESIYSCPEDCTTGDNDKDKKSSKSTRPIDDCEPVWSCSTFSECVDNVKSRRCYDLRSCGLFYNKPLETIGCEDDVPHIIKLNKKSEPIDSALKLSYTKTNSSGDFITLNSDSKPKSKNLLTQIADFFRELLR